MKQNNRWTPEEAQKWAATKPWLCGFNFLPSSAVNSTEMWQSSTIDWKTIEKELALADKAGFNACRVFLQYLVWRKDGWKFMDNFRRFLTTATENGIYVMPILFDDCAFAGLEPYTGKQRPPVPGVHNSGWTPSPGPKIADRKTEWAQLKAYVMEMVGEFGADDRIVAWDLYNEPGAGDREEKSRPLLDAAFRWARQAGPTQPLTVGVWRPFAAPDSGRACGLLPIDARSLELSDVVSFHCYANPAFTRKVVRELKKTGRPVICTEWMARKFDSLIETHLPIFRREHVGAFNWGLVQGKTQTFYPWGSPKGAPEPKLWFHDLFRKDGKPYRKKEIDCIKRITRKKTILIKPVEMTAKLMQDLEAKGLIRLLSPDLSIPARTGETIGKDLYSCRDKYGPHKLIAVVVDRRIPSAFGTHPDNEDFLLIGDPATKPLYLTISFLRRKELESKISKGTLSEKDFVTLRVRYNDPNTGFFTMPADVPHGEFASGETGRPPTFYVTEPRDLPMDKVDFRQFVLKITGKGNR